MTEEYNPPEHKIDKVIEKTGGDPRKLAIAYLRAQKRARDAETAYHLTNDISDAQIAVMKGDGQGAIDKIRAATSRLRQHEDVEASGQRKP